MCADVSTIVRDIYGHLSNHDPQHPTISPKLSPAMVSAAAPTLTVTRSPKLDSVIFLSEARTIDRGTTKASRKDLSSPSWKDIAVGGRALTSSPAEAVLEASTVNVSVPFKESTWDREADLLATMGGDTGRRSAWMGIPESWGRDSSRTPCVVQSETRPRHSGISIQANLLVTVGSDTGPRFTWKKIPG